MITTLFQIAREDDQNNSILTYTEDDCTPISLRAADINAEFAKIDYPPAYPPIPHDFAQEGHLRQMICALYELQSNKDSSRKAAKAYDKLVHGLSDKTLKIMDQIDEGMRPEVFNPIRESFLTQFEQDRESAREARQMDARALREAGATFTLQVV